MKLYNVFYYGKVCDTNIPLPRPPPVGVWYAQCTNMEPEVLMPSGTSWAPTSLPERLMHRYLRNTGKL